MANYLDDSHPQTTARPALILVIEDSTVNLKVMVDYLSKQGFEVVIARSGQMGIMRAKYVKPDIILLDVRMPGMDGFETCRQLKADEETKDIPVIFMTALSEIKDKIEGLEAGAVDYITKPIQFAELLARLKNHLAIRVLQRRLEHQNHRLQQEIDERVQAETALKVAHDEIVTLNQRLQSENTRLEAEINVARQIQQMLLPPSSELQQFDDLEIVGYTVPADEVGGDYYDILYHAGRVKIGIGDVTGHGLESGIIMLMTQTAIRTLLISNIADAQQFLNILNQTIYRNVQRMNLRKNLSLTLLDYRAPNEPSGVGQLKISGQHEQIIIVRQNGQTELIDTLNLGFPIGMVAEVGQFVAEKTTHLAAGEGLLLYTDGVTEAVNGAGEQYGLNRLSAIVGQHWQQPLDLIKTAVVADIEQHVGNQILLDDMTLVIAKRKST